MKASDDKAQRRLDQGESCAPAIRPGDVRAYLEANPEFISGNLDLMAALLPSAYRHGRGIVDMQQFIIRKQQTEIERLKDLHEHFMDTSALNMGAQSRIHDAVLRMLDARTFEHLVNYLTEKLGGVLGIDAVSLCVEAEKTAGSGKVRGIRLLETGSIDTILGQYDDYMLRQAAPGTRLVFGHQAQFVQSEALLRLNISPLAPTGLLALGSYERNFFRPDQGIELLTFLSGSVERILRAWLDLPSE